MRSALKKICITVVATLSLAGAILATSTDAQARYYHRGYGGGWIGPAIVGGLMLGALAASRPYYGYPAYGYGYPAYGYGYPAYGYGPPAYGYGYRAYGYPAYGYGYRAYRYPAYRYGYRAHRYGYRGYRR
jgi:hypothetical protein